MPPSRLAAPARPAEQLVAALDEALGLLEEFSGGAMTAAPPRSPAGVLEECLALCAQTRPARPEPVRTVHHFACTGGTLICKCLAAMPNTQVLSEVDPLSTLRQKPEKHRFAPTDMVALMRQSSRGATTELLVELFLADLGIIHAESSRAGQRLILRDHAHSHFCTGAAIPERPSLHAIVASRFAALPALTVRHPVESYLSLKENGWMHFSPASLEEYCRRYIAFLHAHEGVPMFRYEDFVREPHKVMREMCAVLEIPYSDQFADRFSVFKMSGDSGRRGNVIESRPRRPVDSDLLEESRASSAYRELRAILGYDE